MPYIGKQLSNGNYLKLDDISSGFDSSTTTFSLTNGGSAYYPGSEFSILVSVGGVIQEPESAYQINNDQIIFANAPTAQDSFFCIVLGDAIGINVPGNNTVNGAQMAKPFNYDGGLLYLNDTDNRVGINSTSPSVALDVVGDLNVSGNISGIGGTLGGTLVGNVHSTSGISTFNDLLVNGDLTVQGETTTLNTTLRNVELLRVSAASTLPAGIITQTNTGDILRLYDSSTQVFTVADGGKVGIGTDNPNVELDIEGAQARIHLHDYDGNQAQIIQSGNGFFLNVDSEGNGSGSLQIRVGGNTGTSEKLRITSDGEVGIGTNSPNAKLNIYSSDPGSITPDADADELVLENGGNVGLSLLTAGTGESSIYFGNPGTNGQKEAWIKYYHETHATTGNRRALTFKSGGGSEKMRLSSAGRLGIGTVNPNAQLDVYKVGTGSVVDVLMARSSGGGAFAVQCSDLAASNPVWALRTYANEDLVLSPGGNADVNEKVRIKASDGNVGIGTNNPSYRLQVQSDGDSTTAAGNIVARFQSNGSGRDATIQLSDNVANSATISMLSSNLIFEQAGEETFRISSGGDVGIGEATPDSKLDILHSSSTNPATENLIHLRTDPGVGYVSRGLFIKIGRDLNYDNSAARYDIVGSDGNSGFHAFEVQGNEHLRITKDGRVGIGSTSPTNTLVVREPTDNNSSIQLYRYSTGGDIASVIWATNSGNQAQINYRGGGGNTGMQFYTGGTGSSNLRAIIDTDGKVGIGTADPSAAIDVEANASSGYIAEFRQKHASNSGQIIIDTPADNNVRPASIDLANAGTVKWSLGQAYSSTSSGAFHIATSALSANDNNAKLTITTTGKIGIGTNDPASLLQVGDSLVFNGTELYPTSGIGTNVGHRLNYRRNAPQSRTNTGSASQRYYKIGEIVLNGSESAEINIYGTQGYSDGTECAGKTTIVLRATNGNTLAGFWYEETLGNANLSDVRWKFKSGTTYELWVKASTYANIAPFVRCTGNGFTSFNEDTGSGDAPTGSTAVSTYHRKTVGGVATIRYNPTDTTFHQNIKMDSGKGIDFSATDNEGDLGSELFNDYESGTYTPTLTTGSGGSVSTITSGTLSYIKVGRLMHIQGRLHIGLSASDVTEFEISLPVTNTSGDAYDTSSVQVVIRAHSGEPAGGIRNFRISGNSNKMRMQDEDGMAYGNFGVTNPHINVNVQYYCQ